MSKPEWGTKRQCQSCGSKFYDLQRPEITCPSCGAEVDRESPLRSRRGRAAAPKPAPEEAAKPAVSAAASKNGEDVDGLEDADLEDAGLDDDLGDDADDDIIEDTSDLGDDDMSDVVASSDDDDEG
ncbi:MAG: TIGR02300 family protein [Kiloniellales bacterium]|nr:TIGR02300 family protein [Kiloniellales bacterium]